MVDQITLEQIRKQALELGWDDVGATKACISDDDIAAYRKWLEQGFHASMTYMENELRCFPEQFFPGAKTALIFVSYYRQERVPFRDDAGVVASYARGRDYHNVHRKRLKKMIRWLEEVSGQQDIARGFSDSAPVLEKALAAQAGLGWIGKNTLLIHPKFGTFVLLSGIFTSLDVEGVEMHQHTPRCGECRRCLDTCPMQALVAPYTLDARKCLSYHLIESKEPVPEEVQKRNPGYIFGCDECQNACPHNARKPLSDNPDFTGGVGPYLAPDDYPPEKFFGTPLKRKWD